MRLKLIASVWFFALGLSPMALAADGSCCGKTAAGCCGGDSAMTCLADTPCDMPCCKEKAGDMPCCTPAEPVATAVDVLVAMAGGLDWSLPPTDMPERQTVVVWFDRPTLIGRTILQGKYVIEHDTARMARGEPCTHIYAADDLQAPVVTFHCTHLDAAQTAKTTVLLKSLPDGWRRLVQFQFAGEDFAHGFPTGR